MGACPGLHKGGLVNSLSRSGERLVELYPSLLNYWLMLDSGAWGEEVSLSSVMYTTPGPKGIVPHPQPFRPPLKSVGHKTKSFVHGKGTCRQGADGVTEKREEGEMSQNAFYTCMELSKNKAN